MEYFIKGEFGDIFMQPWLAWNYKMVNVFNIYRRISRAGERTHPLRAQAILAEDKHSILSTHMVHNHV